LAQLYNNKSLFSDYYLEELVSGDSHWQTLKDAAWEYRQRIANTIDKALPGINRDTPEAEVERRFIRPILDVLGHVYFVNPSVPSPEGVRRPDYAFFPSAEARQEAEPYKGQSEFFRTALAVGDAKAWERSLDKRFKGPGDPFTNHNPSYQIDFYLRATDKRWGLLTNGRHWRLYDRDLSYRLDVYYEVDLPQIVKLDEEAFLYFLAFFHKDAFRADGAGRCFLDRAYRASTEYAAKVSEELKDNVYEALRLLVQGFLSFPGNNLGPDDLGIIRENAFIVIYRLLFVLYAEARGFLPVSDPDYQETYSLRALARDITTKEPFDKKLFPVATGYWSRLQDLFRLIDEGWKDNDHYRIPPYNGRLFDDRKAHPRLAVWKIGDRYLAEAIDQLARAKAAGRTGRGFVSYRDLSIRELGSIYEGLLEHRPRHAIQDVAVVKDGKREKLIPLAEQGDCKVLRTYPAGSVYLETDKGERKATGSYYTPDYVVKYIVTNTVGPLLDEAKSSDGNMIEAILSLKVLDPAMGSGHFLVEATDYLARALVEALGADPREVEEEEIRWARREVVERCIYGVDLNPLAVDLAKLSLWLSTVSLDKPLNFLDHHLRCGNSLIGAQLKEMGALPGKALKMKSIGKKAPEVRPSTIWEDWFTQNVATAVDNYFCIAATSSDKIQDIRNKERLYATARDILKRYYQVAHIWTSTYFENEVVPQDYDNLLTSIRATLPAWAEFEKKPWFAEGVEIGEERRFLHWELEFPEVFFDRNGQRLPNPGFNATVGNPPWGAELDSCEKGFIFGEFAYASGKTDSFTYFLELGFVKLAHGGRIGEITPSTIFRADNSQLLRKAFLQSGKWEAAVQLGEGVFGGVSFDSAVLVVARLVPGDISTVRCKVVAREQDFDAIGETEVPLSFFRELGFVVPSLTPSSLRLIKHVNSHAQPLGKLSTIRQGIITGDNKRFLASERLSPRYRPFLKGDLIQRYSIVDDPDWVDYDRDQLLAPREAAIWEAEQKIITQGIRNVYLRDKLLAAYDDQKLCSSQNTNVIWRIITPHHIHFILSLVNCRLLNWYYRLLFTTTDIRCEFQRILPIRRIGFVTPRAERERLTGQGKRLYQEYLQSRDWSRVLDLVSERLPRKADGSPDIEHEQSDVVHDLLAFLAEEMTGLHKQKQAEIRGFLTWLEGYLGVDIEELKNKTRVKEYYEAEVGWEGFLGALEQNRRAIQLAKGMDITRREPQENIRGEFDTTVAKLKPILETIALTDKLIDQIVYKLYGLTPEEIQIVEGSN
jgi:hypothetical protein